MEAIIKTGGKQYRVKPGLILEVEKLDQEPGDEIIFQDILLYKDEEETRVGRPFLEDLEVVGRVLKQDRRRKVIIFKYKPKKRYRRKAGHRQPFTRVLIEDILEKSLETKLETKIVKGADDLG